MPHKERVKPYRIVPAENTEENDAIIRLLHDHTFSCPPPPLHDAFWWLAMSPEGVPVAFAGLHPSAIEGGGYLCRAGVLIAHRGHGLQVRLINARIAKARALDLNFLVTNTVAGNSRSANHLIRCGFRLFNPITPWGNDDDLYWRKELA